jgi:hypothetical protein
VPPPMNAVLMAGCVSCEVALCLLIIWLSLDLHSPATWMHKSGNSHSGHASLGASFYMYANLPL